MRSKEACGGIGKVGLHLEDTRDVYVTERAHW